MSTPIKCLVWDLDNTVWHGVLLEDESVELNQDAVDAIKELDRRGILHSIASRNDEAAAVTKLKEFGIEEYFLFPQINWNSKDSSIGKIAEKINIGLDSIAFVDDQPFDREEVQFSLPEVRTFDSLDVKRLVDLPELSPEFVTEESAQRRHMYRAGITRDEAEAEFVGPKEEFLAGLEMKFRIAPAGEADLQRAEELTVRTNQLNTTGRTYSIEELRRFAGSPNHLLLVAELEDKFGTYGKIGLALVERSEQEWILKLLLMSCRVMSRGVGAVFLNYLMRRASQHGVRFLAELLPNDRNRMMLVTLRLAGFKQVASVGDLLILKNTRREVPDAPSYLEVVAP